MNGIRPKKSKILPADIVNRQEEFIEKIKDYNTDINKFHIQTFGCQLNEHDSESIAATLERLGMVAVDNWEEANLIIFNTCSIRENADRKFWGHLGRIKNKRISERNCLVAVCGCMSKLEPVQKKLNESYPYVDMVFGPDDIYRLPEILYTRLDTNKSVEMISEKDVIAEGLTYTASRKYRALLTIMYGCNNFCTFCIVPYTRGRERSRRVEDIIREAKILDEQGFPELMLLGQNVNSYKSPNEDEASVRFPQLLEAICQNTNFKCIRYMTSHPKDISLELLDIMVKYPQIERHIHLPLQSGSDEILKRMNRRYTKAHYMSIVDAARKRMPDISITTDIIVGFPGETEEDFQATLDTVKEVGYDSAFTFQYSPRFGTPASLLEKQLDEATMTERFQRLLEVQNEASLQANKQHVGKIYEVVIEGLHSRKDAVFTARPSDFHLVNCSLTDEDKKRYGLEVLSEEELNKKLEGASARVRIVEATTFSLNAELEELYI